MKARLFFELLVKDVLIIGMLMLKLIRITIPLNEIDKTYVKDV